MASILYVFQSLHKSKTWKKRIKERGDGVYLRKKTKARRVRTVGSKNKRRNFLVVYILGRLEF